MEIKDRLIKIITSEALTSAAFADSIGVQRSSISHIVSGRNNPSLDFLQKILSSYPKYNAEWLIMGLGDIYKQPIQSNLFNEPVITSNPLPNQPKNEEKDFLIRNTNTSEPSLIEDISQKNTLRDEDKPIYNAIKQPLTEQLLPKEKVIQKIVVFYTDKTFGEYYPE